MGAQMYYDIIAFGSNGAVVSLPQVYKIECVLNRY
jgi:hypothetical protein